MKFLKYSLAALSTAVFLAACGGGGADTTPAVKVGNVKVMGDSLQDIGTFGGVKATVQGADSLLYVERVAQTYGISGQCNFYVFTGTTFAANSKAGCVNYAIGGGVINGKSSNLTAADPRTISVQLQTAVAAGNHSASDLLIIDGGGNDAAALVTAYLGAASGAAGVANYAALLSSVLDGATVNSNLASGPAGFVNAGGLYMTALADTFHTQIKSLALDKGATRVAMINVPGITKTPRFQAVLNGIAAANGGGTAGAAARAQAEAVFDGWVKAFNARLASKFAGNSNVTVVDLYTEFNNQVANPAQFGLTNVKDTACPAVGTGGDGLPTYSFPTCTATALSAATPPAGATGGANWWKTYAFSDGFHPSPYGHQLVAQLISRSLAQAGWL